MYICVCIYIYMHNIYYMYVCIDAKKTTAASSQHLKLPTMAIDHRHDEVEISQSHHIYYDMYMYLIYYVCIHMNCRISYTYVRSFI